MSAKRPVGQPYSAKGSSAVGGSGRSKAPLLVVGGVLLLVVVAGIVALLVSSDDGGDGGASFGAAEQEQAAVEVEGEPLPEYPAGAGPLADPSDDPAVGMAAPTLVGQDFAGDPVTIEPGADGPMVVVFAAHWCPHCQREIPKLQSWLDEGNLPGGVELALVSTGVQADQNNYPPSEWLEQEGWSQPVLLDNPDQLAAQSYGLSGYPYMVFLDGDGNVVQRSSGEVPIDQFDASVQELAV